MGQKYEIIVKLDGLSSTKEEENKEKLESANGKKQKDPDKEKAKKLAKMRKAAKIMVANKVREVTSDAIRTYVSTIGARQDNVAKQNRIQNVMGMTNNLVSGAMSISAADSLAGAPGAIITALAEASKLAIEVTKNLQDYSRLQTKNSLESEKASERLGRIATNRNR